MLELKTKLANNISFRKTFGTYLKTSRKRFFLSIFVTIIIFCLISSFFSIWFSYRFISYDNYISARYNWNDDSKISVFSSNSYHLSPDFSLSHFSDFRNDFSSQINSISPDLVTEENSSAAISFQFYYYNNVSYQWDNCELFALDTESLSLLPFCLHSGRIPTSSNELLYFSLYSNDIYSVNDTVSLYSDIFTNTSLLTYTIVGIVDSNFTQILLRNGRSIDLFSWYEDYNEFSSYSASQLFISTPELLFSAVNAHSVYSGIIAYMLDINYNYLSLDLSKIHKILQKFPSPFHLPLSNVVGNYVLVGEDLQLALSDFLNYWSYESRHVLFICSPIFFLLGILMIVSTGIGWQKTVSFTNLLIKQGLNVKFVRRILLLDNFLITLCGSILGLFLGLLVGYLFILTSSSIPILFVSTILFNGIIFISMSIFLAIYFGINISIKNTKIKNSMNSNEPIKIKGKLGRFFSSQEFGIILIVLILAFLLFVSYYIFLVFDVQLFTSSLLPFYPLFWLFFSIACSFLFYLLFLILSKMLFFLWQKLDLIIWKNCKNFLSLAIKQLSINKESFQNLLLVTFITALLLFPGVIIPKSINQQNICEAELSSGFADLVIEKWDNSNKFLRSKIDNLTSVAHTAQVTQTLAYYYDENLVSDDYFRAYFLSVDNCTHFLDTVQNSLLNKYSINPSVIDSLVGNGTVLCDNDFAQKRELIINNNFTSIGFTSSSNLLDLQLLDTFSSFPLIPLYRQILHSSVYSEIFALVGNNYTIASIIDAFIPQTKYVYDDRLLIAATNSSDISSLKEELENLGFYVKTRADYQ
ncbi:MAG: hypothetical protein ACFFDW_16825, partial [Candidatus Thorarchaeota archaeon]